jgi:superfamily II DNA or RNA helicase
MSWKDSFRPEDIVLGEKIVLLQGVKAEAARTDSIVVGDPLDQQDYVVRISRQTLGGVEREIALCSCRARLQCYHAAAVFLVRHREPARPAMPTPLPRAVLAAAGVPPPTQAPAVPGFTVTPANPVAPSPAPAVAHGAPHFEIDGAPGSSRVFLLTHEGKRAKSLGEVSLDPLVKTDGLHREGEHWLLDGAALGREWMHAVLASGRVWSEGRRLTKGEPVALRFSWAPTPEGFRPQRRVPEGQLRIGQSGMLLDRARGELRPMSDPLPVKVRAWMAARSSVPADMAGKARAEMLAIDPTLPEDFLPPVPPAPPEPELPALRGEPKVRVELAGDKKTGLFLRLWFAYGPVAHARCDREPTFDHAVKDGETFRVYRELAFEQNTREQVEGMDFVTDRRINTLDFNLTERNAFLLWNRTLQPLRDLGWEVSHDPSLGLIYLEAREAAPSFKEEGKGGLTLGCMAHTFKGEVDVIPYLARKVSQAASIEELMAKIDVMKDHEMIALPGEKGEPGIGMPLKIARPILAHFAEMVSTGSKISCKTSRYTALNMVRDVVAPWVCPPALQQQSDGLANPPVVALPKVTATLRPYQEQGFRWLDFWRSIGLNGILADDMGLGKTLQTITLLLSEKEAGRMDRPNLIVAPTSVLPNWKAEINKFAPGLSVELWHGADRPRLTSFSKVNVILTNYALMGRHPDTFAELDYHYAILDEAQNIKNPQAKARQSLMGLDSRHRLCLTGTPVENNLGDLWSLVDYLNPGILRDQTHFRSFFRKPIEEQQNHARTVQLNRRVRSIMIRRTKDEVVDDLPEKTSIVELIPLLPEQAVVYESNRLIASKDVQEAIATKGFKQAQLTILAALGRLRQICDDPRLLAHPKSTAGSGKREALMDMVPSMVESGRKILLFSQYTTMLDLIAEDLKAAGLDYVRIDGDTKDRATPVEAFQAGKVPIFLLSLKAGGTGLNLTAADVVILFDPWWNPAAEDQAIDRAHRIGQTQKVFAYRLIAKGTIEERILGLQAKKRGLAAGALGGTVGDAAPGFSAQDIEYLLAPISAT